ncbi:MAG TPA: carbohydrate ABC transporter permease [Chthoniobacterales bacterium]
MQRRRLEVTALAGLLILMALVTLFPIAPMLLNSVKSDIAVQTNPLALPDHLALDNFSKAWDQAHLGRSIFLSLRIVCLTVCFTCSTTCLTAYALARRKVRSWPLVSGYFLAATTVPITLLIFPLYGLLVRLGLLGNEAVLALIYTAIYTPFSVFLLRSYFLAIPLELEEAAQIDGASGFQIFLQVALPLVTPGVLTVALIVEFYSFQGRFGTQWSLMMANSVLLAGPIIIIFLILQRFFVEGLVAGSVKG